MESIQRSIMMLKPDSALHMDHKNQAILKMQTAPEGLAVDLCAASMPTQDFGLYLFDKDGLDLFTGEIREGRLQTTLPATPLHSIVGAAVVDLHTMAFILKSTGPNWTDIAVRFKFSHATAPPKPKNFEPAPKMEEMPPVSLEPPTWQESIKREQEQEQEIQENNEEPKRQTSQPPDVPGVCDTCPHVIRQDRINPFPSAFPNSDWVKISYPGPTGWWHYISGKVRSGDTVVAKVLGVPGEYGMAPPIWLEGFGTYMRCVTPDAGGYWLMFQDAETGEVLDMGLSPHGE